MWIRSQDRNGLYNVTIVSIFKATNDFQIYGDSDDVLLATYPTHDRALEVQE